MAPISVSRLFRLRSAIFWGVLTSCLAAGCATISVRYEDNPSGAIMVITRHLASPDQYLTYEDYSKLQHATSAKDHVKDLKTKLVLSNLYLMRFASDCEIHLRNAPREEPSAIVISTLSEAFPEDAQELADDKSDLEAEHMPPRDTSSIVAVGSSEELWLVFNKKTNKYYLYANATPDRRQLVSEPQRFVPFRHW
jgi:hypothetical protein